MAERPLGKHQRHLLAGLAGVRIALVVGDKLSRDLVRRGLLAAEPDGSLALTPAGLRRVAAEIEVRRMEMFPPPHKLKKRGGANG